MATTHPAELNRGVWTSWLPVTTAWTSQSGCNSEAWARNGVEVGAGLWPYIYDPAYAQSVANSLTCLPPAATQWWYGGITVTNTVTSFSIGLLCALLLIPPLLRTSSLFRVHLSYVAQRTSFELAYTDWPSLAL
jgi:hypothetical protein